MQQQQLSEGNIYDKFCPADPELVLAYYLFWLGGGALTTYNNVIYINNFMKHFLIILSTLSFVSFLICLCFFYYRKKWLY